MNLSPQFAHFNDDVLFGENWNNQDIDVKTRCIITVTALIASGMINTSLVHHFENAKAHGVTQKEIAAVITHIAFYAGWPKGWAAFNLSLFEQLVGAGNLSAKEKSILDRCTADVYRDYMRGGYKGQVPTLKDLYRQLMLQPEEEARGLALSSELFINGSLNTFAQETNVNTKSRIIDYDIRELGEQLMPLGMLVTLDSIFNRVIQNWKKGKTTWIFADEFYLLFRYEYSADFFYRLYKRIRKYSGFVTGLTQNVEELLKSDTARLMLANSEFLILFESGKHRPGRACGTSEYLGQPVILHHQCGCRPRPDPLLRESGAV